MIIKNEIELFTKVGVINQYNTLINQLASLGFTLHDLAETEYYGDDLFKDSNFDEYNQEYTYSCLNELKSAFNQKTGAELILTIDDFKSHYPEATWKVKDFYITVRNPKIKNISEDDLEESEYELC